MPRINIEDSLFRDDRYLDLVLEVGDQDKALGLVIRGFMLAQRHYLSLDNERLIPLNEWERMKAGDLLIKVGLAIKKNRGVYVCGTNEQFAWLLQKQAAGKAPKKQRKKQKKRPLSPDNVRSSYANGSKPLTLTLTQKENIYTGIRPENIMQAWNDNCGALPKCKKLSPDRIKKCNARIGEVPSLPDWVTGIKYIANSNFFNGQNDRNWNADFDYILQPGKILKALENADSCGAGDYQKALDMLDAKD